jgi:cytochrome c oxidase cbb3-type subunit 3
MRRDPQTALVLAAAGILVVTLAASVGAQRRAPQGRRGGPPGPQPAAKTSSAADEATARRLCAICHPFEHVVAIRRTRAQWEATVESMVARGARGTSAELATVIDYLSENNGLGGPMVRGGAGPDEKPLVDPKASEMARPLWVSDCQSCHGADARGTVKGPNLVRSLVVLHDRYGSTLGPYLRKEHPPIAYTPAAPAPTAPAAGARTAPAAAAPGLTDTQVLLLAHFLRDRVNDTLRGAPAFKPGNVLTGDPKAGAEYFNGEGGCVKCHSPGGDLAGIGARLEPVAIQQRFLFPMISASRGRSSGGSDPVTTVTVTTETGETVSGELITMDDFNVSLKDAAGMPRTIRLTARTQVVKNNPFAAHIDLLSHISDQNIHDVVAYLASLK